MQQIINYFRDTMAEMRQVNWPTSRQAMLYTMLVIAISVVVALYVGAFDYLFSWLVSLLVERF